MKGGRIDGVVMEISWDGKKGGEGMEGRERGRERRKKIVKE